MAMIHPKKPTGRGSLGSSLNDSNNRNARNLGLPTNGPQFISPAKPNNVRVQMARKAATASKGRALWSQDRITKAGSNYGVAKARPNQRKAGGFALSGSSGSGYGKLTVFGYFSDSSKEEMRIVRGVSPDLLERWWALDNNELPQPDYATWLPTTDDDLREEYRDLDRAEYDRTVSEIDQLRDENRQTVAVYLQRIAELEGEINQTRDPDEIAELTSERRKTQGLKREVDAEHATEEKRLKDAYKDNREDQWQDLVRRQRLEMAKAEDKVEDLKTTMVNEVQQAADKWFTTSDLFSVERWILE